MNVKKAPKKGSLLLSKPMIGDGFFEQSVVYLTEHDNQGSLGFALNKESNLRAQDFIDGLSGVDPIYFGGPVEQDALFFLHSFDNLPGAQDAGNGMHLGGDFELFKEVFTEAKEAELNELEPKFFLGYSGWSAGQLEQEIAGGTWIILDPPFESSPLHMQKDAWRELMIKLGGKYALWANAPLDPLMN